MDFDLGGLGWKNFEDLALTICQHAYELKVTRYAAGRDQGRDGSGIVGDRVRGSIANWGEVVVQCKHTSNDERLAKRHIADDLPKIKNLVDAGLCDTYLLFTNRRTSASVAASITQLIKQQGAEKVIVHGRETIDKLLTEDKKLRSVVPRVYGLGDLSEILDGRVIDQTRAALDLSDIRKFVPTSPYFKTLNALESQGLAILTGPPASGKSSILMTAAVNAVDRWEIEPIWISNMHDVRTHWNPNRPSQLLLLDDAFGSTNFDPAAAEEWNRQLPFIKAALASGTKLLVTSRDYVYHAAKQQLKRGDLPRSQESEILIEVEKLTLGERQRMVYNHLRMGNQPIRFKRAVKPYLSRFTRTPGMLPEVARRLGDSRFTRELNFRNPEELRRFINEPREYLLSVINSLNANLQNALVLLLSENESIDVSIPSAVTQSAVAIRLGLTQSILSTALVHLDGSLVRRVDLGTSTEWHPRHPTVSDAVSDWILQQDHMLDLYIEYAPFESLVRRVSCGLDIRGTIGVNRSIWPVIIERLNSEGADPQTAIRFLAYRCSVKVTDLESWGEDQARLLLGHAFKAPLDSDAGVRWFLRLEASRRLSDSDVGALVRRIVDEAVRELDPYCLRHPNFEAIVVDLHGEDGWIEILQEHIDRIEDLPRYVRKAMRDHVAGLVTRQDAMAPLLDFIELVEDFIPPESGLTDIVQSERSKIHRWAGESESRPSEGITEFLSRWLFGSTLDEDIFDDVDEPVRQ